MSNVIQLSDYTADQWKEVFAVDGPNTILQVYVNKQTGEGEVVQQNDDNETIRTTFDSVDVALLMAALKGKVV